ncbi:MAG: radical SAM protein, partial [Chloroflexota bacterium]
NVCCIMEAWRRAEFDILGRSALGGTMDEFQGVDPMKVNLIFPFPQDMIEPLGGTIFLEDVLRRAFGWGKTNFIPPLSLLMLGAVTPPDIEVKIIDERIEKPDYDEPVDLVGISVVTRSAPRAYQIAEEYRNRGVKVALGGIHPSALPAEAAQHADTVVLGEGEGVWPELLRDFQQGKLQPIYRGRVQMDLDALPFPRRELIRNPDMYVTTKAIAATRGCPNTCAFCAAGVGLIKKYRKRSVENVIRELEQVPGDIADFVDDNTGCDPEYFKALMRAMIPLRLKWSTSVSVNALEDAETINLAAKSGCYSLGVGFESLSPKTLASIRKDKTNRPERYAECIRRAQEAGMAAWGNFIVGFDEDTGESIREVVDFVNRTNLEIACVYILVPYPGSAIYKQYRNEGRLLHQNWRYYEPADGPCVYIPKQMTPDELMDSYLEINERLYSWKSILRRLARSKSFPSFGTLAALHINIQNRRAIPLQKAQARRYREYLRLEGPNL